MTRLALILWRIKMDIEKRFCEELQELLDRYKIQLEVPTIMRNAQKIFRNTLSIRHHPELHSKTIEINGFIIPKDLYDSFCDKSIEYIKEWCGIPLPNNNDIDHPVSNNSEKENKNE